MKAPKDPADMLFEPTGVLSKDYCAYCEIEDRGEREDLLDGILVEDDDERQGRTTILVRNLEYCLNKRDLQPLANAIPHCSNLTSVSFTSSGLTEHSYKILVDAVYKSPSVVSVSVDFNPDGLFRDPTVSKKDKNEVLLYPSQCRGIHLKVENETVVDTKKGKDKKAQQQVKEEPVVDKPPISVPGGWHAILLTGIQQLSLRGNGITDKQAELIGSFLETNPDLLSLSLWGNVITDAGAEAIAKSLAANRRLTALNLGHNKLSDSSIEQFARILYTSDVSSEAALKARERLYPTERELPLYPTFNDLHLATQTADSDPKKDAKKKDAKGKKGDGPVERLKVPFDKDCVRLDEGKIRVPGCTSLWSLSLAHNVDITPAGVAFMITAFNTIQPDFEHYTEGTLPDPYCVGLNLEHVELDHPQLDGSCQQELERSIDLFHNPPKASESVNGEE